MANGLPDDLLGDLFDDFDDPPVRPPVEAADDQATRDQAIADDLAMSQCVEAIQELFEGIQPEHVQNLWKSNVALRDPQAILNHLLNEEDEGRPWPKVEKAKVSAKRKRSTSSEGEEEYKAAHPEVASSRYRMTAKDMLLHDFPYINANFVTSTYRAHAYRFYEAHVKLQELMLQYSDSNQVFKKNLYERKSDFKVEFGKENVESVVKTGRSLDQIKRYEHEIVLLFTDLQHARRANTKIRARVEAEVAEANNLNDAVATGTMETCGTCFCDYPINRMVCCENPTDVHFFCRSCLRTHAETEVGKGLYTVACISMDNCSAGFSKEQRLLFLTPKLMDTMERLELEESLRLAGIENLESCPFCPYAAEYPPIEENRIFKCQHEDCMVESCRNCRKPQHIPLTCEENAKTAGAEAHRRRIEDLMSEALLRKCNKCATPFVKSEGCNKITCTKCRNLQCYVCGKDVKDYTHFNDPSRGGEAGKCKLFDSTEDRHQEDVTKAQKEAIAKILEEHPEFKDVDLEIAQTAAEKEDRERRVRLDPLHYHRLLVEAENAIDRVRPVAFNGDRNRPPFPDPPARARPARAPRQYPVGGLRPAAGAGDAEIAQPGGPANGGGGPENDPLAAVYGIDVLQERLDRMRRLLDEPAEAHLERLDRMRRLLDRDDYLRFGDRERDIWDPLMFDPGRAVPPAGPHRRNAILPALVPARFPAAPPVAPNPVADAAEEAAIEEPARNLRVIDPRRNYDDIMNDMVINLRPPAEDGDRVRLARGHLAPRLRGMFNPRIHRLDPRPDAGGAPPPA